MTRSSRSRSLWVVGMVAAATLGSAACSTTGSGPATRDGRAPLRVVAAENVWGSIAAQLGGTRAKVTSLITNPDTDPHGYEPTPADSRSVASAGYVIVNGIGYDPWAPKLLAANPRNGRGVLNVGDLVGVKAGGNPHRWYSPPDVYRVIDQITADYQRLSPADAAYFERLKATFTSAAMGRYTSLIADIKARFSGTPIGASESVVSPLADALGLDLITPASFLKAISEGSEPTAADKTTCENQIATHRIKVYLFNQQNSTPDVQAQVDSARAAGIPITPVTETVLPPAASFEDWQTAQLQSLEAALGQATGR